MRDEVGSMKSEEVKREEVKRFKVLLYPLPLTLNSP
jgi:hypothetical protein